MTPQLATAAFIAGYEVPPAGQMKHWWEWSPFTYPFNLTQQPAAAVPCGFTKSGLPVSMQIVGAKFSDPIVLRAAYAYEVAHPFVLPSAGFAKGEMPPNGGARNVWSAFLSKSHGILK